MRSLGRPVSSATEMLPMGAMTMRFLSVTPLIWMGEKRCSKGWSSPLRRPCANRSSRAKPGAVLLGQAPDHLCSVSIHSPRTSRAAYATPRHATRSAARRSRSTGPPKRLVSYGCQGRQRGGSHEATHRPRCDSTLPAALGRTGRGGNVGAPQIRGGIDRGVPQSRDPGLDVGPTPRFDAGPPPDSGGRRAEARRLDVCRLRQRRQRPRLHLAAVHPERRCGRCPPTPP